MSYVLGNCVLMCLIVAGFAIFVVYVPKLPEE